MRSKTAKNSAEMTRIPCPPPGVYENVEPWVYHSWNAVNNSSLNHMLKSPAHYRYNLLNPTEQTPAMRLGTAIHALVLEPETFGKHYTVAERCRSKTGKGEACKNPGTRKRLSGWYCSVSGHDPVDGPLAPEIILPQEDLDTCFLVQKSIQAHPAASKLLWACPKRELSLVWVDAASGITCKARLDGFGDVKGELIILDLKSCSDASLKGFTKSVYDRGYFRAGAHYANGVDAVGLGEVRSVVFVCAETTPPYAVAVRRIRDDVLDLGRAEIQRLLLQVAECTRWDDWLAYSQEIEEVGIPAWAIKEIGER